MNIIAVNYVVIEESATPEQVEPIARQFDEIPRRKEVLQRLMRERMLEAAKRMLWGSRN